MERVSLGKAVPNVAQPAAVVDWSASFNDHRRRRELKENLR
jgi:hypothetical protein